MLLLWSGDPALRTTVLEKKKEARKGTQAPGFLEGEGLAAISLADRCPPEAGLGCQAPHRAQFGPALLEGPDQDSQALQLQRHTASLINRLGH